MDLETDKMATQPQPLYRSMRYSPEFVGQFL